MSQQNSFLITEDRSKVVLTCTCDALDHGVVQFEIEPPMKEDDITEEVFFLQFWATPYAKNWFERFKNALWILGGNPLNLDLFVSKGDTRKLNDWITERLNLAPYPKGNMSLKELREKLSETSESNSDNTLSK